MHHLGAYGLLKSYIPFEVQKIVYQSYVFMDGFWNTCVISLYTFEKTCLLHVYVIIV